MESFENKPYQPAMEKETRTCPRCGGTGLVCAHRPEIKPGSCCADFANAVCPACNGTGKAIEEAEPRKSSS